ncbi:MAG: hypothetical protein EGQ38_00580 [Dialister sp.]|nr:hypothetical protein [Dialister sp.]
MKTPLSERMAGFYGLWFMVYGSGFRVYCLLIGMKASYEWGMRNEGSGFAAILRLRSQLFWHSLSHIRRFSSLRMTKRGDAQGSI